MTDGEIFKFKTKLTARQADLKRLLSNRESAKIEASADTIDQIQNMGERELTLCNLARESAYLLETRAALGRVDAGSFGICLDCEEDINPKRLAAVPWASRCIACQERDDRQSTSREKIAELLLAAAA